MAQNIQDYQLKYGKLVLGRDTPYGIRAIRGLYDMDVDSGAVPIPRGDGNIPGEDWVRAKDIELELTVEGPRQSTQLAEDLAELRKVFQRQRTPQNLWVKKPGEPEQYIRVRPIGRAIQEDVQSEHGLKPVMIRLHAADPRLYSTDSKALAMDVHETDSGGTEFDMDFSVDFTIDASSSFIAHNAGDARAYPIIRFNGPTDGGTIDGVTIFNETAGVELDVQTAVLSGQTLKADMLAYIRASGDQVIGLDGSSRYGDWVVPREAFYLQPGDNLLRYEVTGTSSESVVSVTWFDTSI